SPPVGREGTESLFMASCQKRGGREKWVVGPRPTRVVRLFAQRFTVRERLGQQIVGTLEGVLEPNGGAGYLEAHLLCTEMRGVRAVLPRNPSFARPRPSSKRTVLPLHGPETYEPGQQKGIVEVMIAKQPWLMCWHPSRPGQERVPAGGD